MLIENKKFYELCNEILNDYKEIKIHRRNKDICKNGIQPTGEARDKIKKMLRNIRCIAESHRNERTIKSLLSRDLIDRYKGYNGHKESYIHKITNNVVEHINKNYLDKNYIVYDLLDNELLNEIINEINDKIIPNYSGCDIPNDTSSIDPDIEILI